LADDALGAVLPRLDGPYALFGHSLGALVAFELARRLKHLYQRPAAHLFVSGHCAPQLPPQPDNDYKLAMPHCVDRPRQLAGTPDEVRADPELLALVAPILRADFEASDTYQYRPAPPLDCPITVFGGHVDPEAPTDTLPPWQEQTTAGCDVRILPGD